MLDKTNVDLNAPAFGKGAQTLSDLTKDASVEEKEVKESEDNTQNVKEEETETSEEETQVPYSRFKKFHDQAKENKRIADEYRAEIEALKSNSSRTNEDEEDEMPSYWKELYGDSDASLKAWKIQQRREEEIERRAYEAGQRGAQELERIQRERIESNVATIDDNFDELSSLIGRDLTAKEQSEILDIVDDYTAKDSYGNYAGEVMPFDKAWEIYELKHNSAKSSQRKDRDSVASLSGTSTQGDTSVQAEQDKNWNPLARRSWAKRL